MQNWLGFVLFASEYSTRPAGTISHSAGSVFVCSWHNFHVLLFLALPHQNNAISRVNYSYMWTTQKRSNGVCHTWNPDDPCCSEKYLVEVNTTRTLYTKRGSIFCEVRWFSPSLSFAQSALTEKCELWYGNLLIALLVVFLVEKHINFHRADCWEELVPFWNYSCHQGIKIWVKILNQNKKQS